MKLKGTKVCSRCKKELPIEMFTKNKNCIDYCTLQNRLDDLIRYITNCITHREKFNIGAYMNLRKAIMKKMYIIAHLELGYEQNEV